MEKVSKTTWPNKFQTDAVKVLSRGKGPNKTLNSISKVCKATTGIYQIVQELDSSVAIHKTPVEHTTRHSLKDEQEMVHDLLQLNPFRYVSARCHDSFSEIKRSPLKYLNIVEFHEWLDKHMKELAA